MLAAVASLATGGLVVGRYGRSWLTTAEELGQAAGGAGIPGGINPLLQIQRAVAPLLADDWSAFDLLVCTAAASMAVAMLEAWRHLFALAARADGPAVAQRCRATWKRYLVGVGIIIAMAVGTNMVDWFDWRLPGWMYEWTALVMSGVVLLVLLWVWWATVGLTREFRRLVVEAHAH